MPYVKRFDEIIVQFREGVLSGKWKPGEKLPSERVLCEEFGVSRPAMREAFRALETIGIVKCNHGEGNYLASDTSACLIEPLSIMYSFSGGSIMQVYQLRRALERETVRLCALSATEEQVTLLNSLCTRIAASDSETERASLDRDLHESIARFADSPLILSSLHASSALFDEVMVGVRAMILNDRGGVVMDQQHERIVSAIAAHDPYQAVRTMDEHMELIEQYILRIMQARRQGEDGAEATE